MNVFVRIVLISLFFIGCSTTHFEKHKGLTFKSIDWSEDLEQPFIINSYISPELGDRKINLYLPAKLFKNTTITSVFYNGMKSNDVLYTIDNTNRIAVFFDQDLHTIDSFPYALKLDQSVVVIQIDDLEKTIRIENIRVPFLNKVSDAK
jgi:hypothetical protein